MDMNPKWLSLSLQNKILTPATNDRDDYISTCGMWVLTIDTHSHVTQATNGSQVAWELLKTLNLPFQPNPNFLPPNLSVKALSVYCLLSLVRSEASPVSFI